MILIFAVDRNWNIGLDGDMLIHIRQDLKRFKSLTEGNIVIMGRKTFEALPNKQPLPDRTNIVISSRDYDFEDDYSVKSIEELDDLLGKINKDGTRQVFVTGGQVVVEQLIDRCNRAYITKILKSFERSDTSLHNLDEDKNWEMVSESEVYSEDGVDFKYLEYSRVVDEKR